MKTTRSILPVLLACFGPQRTVAFVGPKNTQLLAARPAAWVSTRGIAPLHREATPRYMVSQVASTAVAPVADTTRRKKRLAAGMAFLTAWSDIALYLQYGTFCTMMSGNFLWMANKGLAEQNFVRALYYASVILSYCTGLAVFRRLDLNLRKESMRLCSVIVATLFVASDLVYCQTQTKWLPAMLLATGFGIINSVGSEVAGTLTFVVTGHITRLTHTVVDRLSRNRTKINRAATMQNAAVLGGFFCGAIFASRLQSKHIFSAIGILYGILFYWLDMELAGGAWWLRRGGEMCDLEDDGISCDSVEKRDSFLRRGYWKRSTTSPKP